jgi:NodT family efflux transporter outer membrane factor (OMF) lipoprotein
MPRPAPRRRAPTAVLLTVAYALAGCSLVPDYERPSTPAQPAWSTPAAASVAAVPVSADWWQHFASPELDALMAEALAANQDLAAAIARIDQARANTRIAGAPLLPSVEASGSTSGTRSRTNQHTHGSSSGEALLTASYEIDLWGKNASGLESSKHTLTATAFDGDALALVIQSEVASTYFDAVSLRQRLAIARENLAAAQQVLKLVQIQMAQGAATALDLAQQRTAVATFEAQIPTLEQQLAADQTSLAILLGRAPGGTTVERDKLDALTLPAIAAGQPADLLERRPDIAEAEASLKAANADIGVARAAFYPSLTLSASAAISGLATSGASTAASIAAGLIAPIFEGGALEGQLDLTKARKQELVASYRQTVLTSFKEVEDALSTVETSAARVRSLQTAADQAREAFRLAQLSYGAGASDFLTVLDAQRTLLDNEDSLVQAERDRFTAAASLFKALGGGWAGSA